MSEEPGRLFDFLKRRRITYNLAANQPAVQDMLIDLAVFCRANSSTVALDKDGKVDRDLSLILEGRREVWLRIANHLNLTTKQLYALYTGQQFNPGEELNG
jgi:hypothetical protein